MKPPSCRCGSCRKCKVRKNAAAYRERNRERFNANARAHYRRHREEELERAARRRAEEPEKKKARSIVGNALRGGKIERKPCEVCGDTNSQAHHDDYSKPLDVRWLCGIHHAKEHVCVSLIISDVTLEPPDLPEDEETMALAAEADAVISLHQDTQGHQQAHFIKHISGPDKDEVWVVDLA